MTRKRTDPHKRLEQLQSEQAELEDFSSDPIEHWARKCLRYFRDPRRLVTCRVCRGSGKEEYGSRYEACGSCRGKGAYLNKEGHALYDRAIVDMLETCKASGSPPPDALIRLIEFRLLGDRKPKAKQRDSPRWSAAVKYRAGHPQCSISEIKAAVKRGLPDEPLLANGTLSSWLKDSDFRVDVIFLAELTRDLEGWKLS